MELDSTPAVCYFPFSDGLERSQQRWSGYTSKIGRTQHNRTDNIRNADMIVDDFYEKYV